MGKVGVGTHAIQDIEAHGGASNAEHLDYKNQPLSVGKMVGNDIHGSTTNSEVNTKGIGIIVGVISGNQKVIGRALDKKGVINVTLTSDAVNKKSFKAIQDAILNSDYKGSVKIKFQ